MERYCVYLMKYRLLLVELKNELTLPETQPPHVDYLDLLLMDFPSSWPCFLVLSDFEIDFSRRSPPHENTISKKRDLSSPDDGLENRCLLSVSYY